MKILILTLFVSCSKMNPHRICVNGKAYINKGVLYGDGAYIEDQDILIKGKKCFSSKEIKEESEQL